MAPMNKPLLLAIVAVASSAEAFAPSAALQRGVTRSRSAINMAYIPDGLTPDQWKTIKEKERVAADKNLGAVGTTKFKSRSFEAFHQALESGTGGHLFPVDLSKVKSGELSEAQVPYMMRKNGAWDDSDVVDKVPGAKQKAWLPADERYANGGMAKSQSVNLFGTQVNMPWRGEAQPGYERAAVAPVAPPMPKGKAAGAAPKAAKSASAAAKVAPKVVPVKRFGLF